VVVAATNFLRVVGGGEYYDGHRVEGRVVLYLYEDFNTIDLGHTDVKEQDIGDVGLDVRASFVAVKKKIEYFLSVLEVEYFGIDA
jgi:hypothetical protein